MDTTFRFSSTQEITQEFVEQIKTLYKGKAVSITVTEDFYVPTWQKEEVLRRREEIKNHPESLIGFDEMMNALETELKDEN